MEQIDQNGIKNHKNLHHKLSNLKFDFDPPQSPQTTLNSSRIPDETTDTDTLSVPRLIRSSSLKNCEDSGSHTPRTKKIVRFADALGLDLADVKVFLDDFLEPKSNVAVGKVGQQEVTAVPFVKLVPKFQQPYLAYDFLDKIEKDKVGLENCSFTESNELVGLVRVRNIGFYKSVYLRYTLDEWVRFHELQAQYVEKSCDGYSDRFQFRLKIPPNELKDSVIFAIRYHCEGGQYWDNNGGSNYYLYCVRD